MPTYVSPGVYTTETDISDYIASVNSSIVGMVGFASRGPIDDATLITQGNQLVTKFGNPSEDLYGQGLEGALKVLETTNSLYFVRAGGDSASDASAILPWGACPAVLIKEGNFGVFNDLWLRIQAMSESGEKAFADEGRVFFIPQDTHPSLQSQALRAIIGGGGIEDRVGVYGAGTEDSNRRRGIIAGLWAGSGACLSVTAWDALDVNGELVDDNLASVLCAMDIEGNASSSPDGPTNSPASINEANCAPIMKIYGPQYKGLTNSNLATGINDNVGYLVESLFEGAGYNEGMLPSTGNTSGVSITVNTLGEGLVELNVFDNGAIAEGYQISLEDTETYVEQVINTGNAPGSISELIKGETAAGNIPHNMFPMNSFAEKLNNLVGTGTTVKGVPPFYLSAVAAGTNLGSNYPGNPDLQDADCRLTKFVEVNTGLQGGDNGVNPANVPSIINSLVGHPGESPKQGLQALDNPLINISMAAIPGVAIQTVQDSLIALAEGSQNFMAVVAPPYGLGSVQNAIDWSNGLFPSRTTAINSSYAAVYWPWVRSWSPADLKDRWLDPSIFALQAMCNTDAVAETWFAPAGLNRARLGSMGSNPPDAVEVDLSQGDRDTMYSGGNVVNPIVNFAIDGVTIWGQRTAQRKPTALDRINVRRMIILIRKSILRSTRQYVFEPNDAFTWQRIVNVLNPFLNDIKVRRGITQFKVVCDETTNTPARVDRNEMWCKVIMKPTKTAEMIIFEINLTNQSASI